MDKPSTALSGPFMSGVTKEGVFFFLVCFMRSWGRWGIFYRIFGCRDIAQVLRCLWRCREAGGLGKDLEFGRHMRRPGSVKKDFEEYRRASSISAF